MRLILDASVTLELLLNTAVRQRHGQAILDDGQDLHAPHLIDLEFAQTLRRLVFSKQLHLPLAEEALQNLKSIGIERHPHDDLLSRIWQLRASVSAYDAAYIALAERLDAPLFTCDGRLSRSHGHGADIRLIA